MSLPINKTKIVCTIGPASESPEILERMVAAGMNVARLNFSHGDFERHRQCIENIRAAAHKLDRRVAIAADLPGPKIRIGKLAEEPIELKPGEPLTLTTEETIGSPSRISVSFDRLPGVVGPGDVIYLNDGFIQLEVVRVEQHDVRCRVRVGGELRSHKGLNLPGIELGIPAFTEHDRTCLKFALEHGVDAVCQSFVESEEDILSVREAAAAMGHEPFIIAKLERALARRHIGAIFEASDAIMVARGDLGVETPIEEIAVVQKQLIHKANLVGKPVITATQMLESMVGNPLPTRAEATDVANAILDGTDCVMLSGESAVGKYPVQSVQMLVKIAAATEPHRPRQPVWETIETSAEENRADPTELVALSVATTAARVSPAAIFVPTLSGASARRITRFRLPVWITAVSTEDRTCQRLLFSYGVYPVHEPIHPGNWNSYARDWMRSHDIAGDLVLLTEGPSPANPEANNRLEIIDLDSPPTWV